MKFGNIRFVGNLIGTYTGIFITMTSFVLGTQSVSAVFCPAVFLQLASVQQYCELNEKSEQVQQANMFKRQTLMFHFSTYHPNSLKHLSHPTLV